jgi:hypothetical protein
MIITQRFMIGGFIMNNDCDCCVFVKVDWDMSGHEYTPEELKEATPPEKVLVPTQVIEDEEESGFLVCDWLSDEYEVCVNDWRVL